MVSCCIANCSVTKQNNPNKYTFHRFPSRPAFFEKWVRVVNRSGWSPRTYSTVCSKHFDENCFIKRGPRRLLLKDSIPTLFVPVKLINPRKASSYVNRDIVIPNHEPDPYLKQKENKLLAKNASLKQKISEKNNTIRYLKAKNKRLEMKILTLKEGIPDCNQALDIPGGEELVLRVYHYLQAEYKQLKQSSSSSPSDDIVKRTAAATGVSEDTVISLLNCYEPTDDENSDDEAPVKRLKLDTYSDEDDLKENGDSGPIRVTSEPVKVKMRPTDSETMSQNEQFGREQFEVKNEQEQFEMNNEQEQFETENEQEESETEIEQEESETEIEQEESETEIEQEEFETEIEQKEFETEIELEHIETNIEQEQFEAEIEQKHNITEQCGQKDQDDSSKIEPVTIKCEADDDDEQTEHDPLEQSCQLQTSEKQATNQEQNKGTDEQYAVKIKEEKDNEENRASGHMPITSEGEPVNVKIELGYSETDTILENGASGHIQVTSEPVKVKIEPGDSETTLSS